MKYEKPPVLFNIEEKNRRKKPEYYEKLEGLLKNIAQEMNDEFKCYLNSEKRGDLFEGDCSIRMNAFQKGENGPYAKEDDIKKDKQFIKDEELEWSEAENEKVRLYYKNEYKAWDDNDDEKKQTEKTVAKWKEMQEKRIGNLLEMAIVGIFYKILKNSNLSIMRSAKYDDYTNGVDTIMVDKETGQVICAFDEVSDEEGKDERRKNKLKRMKHKAKQQGGELKYGITFEKNNENKSVLVKKNLTNIPMFCLNLPKNELEKILGEMKFDTDTCPREIELAFFNKMVFLMEEQMQNLLKEQRLNENVKENLQAIPEALQKMRDASAQYKM
ncbi:MAG: hypothetical protein ABIC82_06325 [bacterium]